ncbi:MAG: hypothetical protein WAT23_05365 [Chromatiaceae bacterium]
MKILHSDTAIAIQNYQELQGILNGKDFNDIKLLTGTASRDRAYFLIYRLCDYLSDLENNFHLSNLESIPVMEFGSAHAKFLSQELIPNAK